jgi:arylsulfatase A-like enzyme
MRITLTGIRDGLLVGSLLGIVHTAVLASAGLYATSPFLEIVASGARYAGLLGLTGGILGLLIGIVSMVFARATAWRPSPAATLLIVGYASLWLLFALDGPFGRALAALATGIAALLLLGLWGWLSFRRQMPAGSKRPRALWALLVVDVVLLLASLVLRPSPPAADALALDGTRLEALRARAQRSFTGQRWNLLLLTVDTLRADHLGCYGYERETTPAIDALADRGIRFDQAICQRPKTSPSFATIHTGTYPAYHGIHRAMMVLRDYNLTLAEILSQAGWSSAAVITNGNLYPDFGFDQGFETYLYGHQGARIGSDLALDWLAENARAREPWFLWVHHTDPHTPYDPPEPYNWMFRGTPEVNSSPNLEQIALYDGEIRYTDDQLRRILEWVARSGLGGRTLIVFVADHGESLGEHDYYYEHGLHAYEPSARIPLIFTAPTVIPSGRMSHAMVGAVDILPTVLDALGVKVPEVVQGRSFLPAVLGTVDMGPRDFVFLEAGYGVHLPSGRTRALRRSGTKYVQRVTSWARYPRDPVAVFWTMDAFREGALAPDEFYDLTSDPGETVNLLTARPEEARRERELIAGFVTQLPSGTTEGSGTAASGLDPETLEALRSLGYIR